MNMEPNEWTTVVKKRPACPSESWWCQPTREAFIERSRRELPRMGVDAARSGGEEYQADAAGREIAMKAPRVEAWSVNIGDEILTSYGPRTWLPVTEVVIDKEVNPYREVMIDTSRNRTWWRKTDLIACRRRGED